MRPCGSPLPRGRLTVERAQVAKNIPARYAAQRVQRPSLVDESPFRLFLLDNPGPYRGKGMALCALFTSDNRASRKPSDRRIDARTRHSGAAVVQRDLDVTTRRDAGHLLVATTQAAGPRRPQTVPSITPDGSNRAKGAETVRWPRFIRLRCSAGGLLLLFALLASPALATEPSTACGSGGPIPAGCGNIVFDGDSISAGAGASAGQHPDAQFIRALGSPVRLWNAAAGGRPVSDCLRLFSVNVAPHIAPGATFNLIVFHAGDNDIAQGRDAAATYQAFTAYVAAAHHQGWKLVVSTELPRPDFPPARAAELDAYNGRLVANQAGADAVVDLSADPRLTDPHDRAASGWYAPDRVHLNDAGYGVMTRRLVRAARPLLPQGPDVR